jgi:hypothetical protein
VGQSEVCKRERQGHARWSYLGEEFNLLEGGLAVLPAFISSHPRAGKSVISTGVYLNRMMRLRRVIVEYQSALSEPTCHVDGFRQGCRVDVRRNFISQLWGRVRWSLPSHMTK